MTKLVIEGQTYDIPDEVATHGATVAEQDQHLLDVLRPNFELAANATLRRETKDGTLTITVVKAPGTKGAAASYERIVRALAQAPHEISPLMAFACSVQLLEVRGKLTRDRLIRLRPRIEEVLSVDEDEQAAISFARQVLMQAPPVASATIPVGF